MLKLKARMKYLRRKASSRIGKDGRKGLAAFFFRGQTQFKNEPPWLQPTSFFLRLVYDLMLQKLVRCCKSGKVGTGI